jgi:acetylornithine deacetylase/succinyl-diaminopimelate desuccinylase-like protein
MKTTVGHVRLLTCAAIASLAAAAAHAEQQPRYMSANAASYCQTALPVFDGNVRKRPLAVANEGTGNAFVTCSFTAQATSLSSVRLKAANASGAEVELSCTGVTGAVTESLGPTEYVTKTVTVPMSGQHLLSWSGVDFDGAPAVIPGSGLFSVSCNLPPGTSLNDSAVQFTEEVDDVFPERFASAVGEEVAD